jgi:hypothetical protein
MGDSITSARVLMIGGLIIRKGHPKTAASFDEAAHRPKPGRCGPVALPRKLWQSALVQNRLFQRCFLSLGMVAMLGALASMPLASTYAFAMSAQSSKSMVMNVAHDAHKAAEDCDSPAKHCPDCPQKVCPEMGSCLVKCFQPLPTPVSESRLHGDIVADRVAPATSAVTASSLIPPLLRPPSV